MAKLVTQRFEYACFDDSQGKLVPTDGSPPTWPPALENYSSSSVATAAQSYGSMVLPVSGTPVPLPVPPGATLTLYGDDANTVNVGLSFAATPLVPGGAPQTGFWPVAPKQLVTFPGVLNVGTLSVQSLTNTLAASTATGSVRITWSL